jgi:hypothetical protein
VGGGCRRLELRLADERELPDRPRERPVDRPLPEERDDPPERERDFEL